jgi:hypothetical protein
MFHGILNLLTTFIKNNSAMSSVELSIWIGISEVALENTSTTTKIPLNPLVNWHLMSDEWGSVGGFIWLYIFADGK